MLCGSIDIENTQQTLKKIMDSHLSGVQRILNNGQKPYSFAEYYKQHFNSTTPCNYILNLWY